MGLSMGDATTQRYPQSEAVADQEPRHDTTRLHVAPGRRRHHATLDELARKAKAVGRRTFDIGFASFALLVTAPIALVLVVLIRLTSEGPAMYQHRRLGLHGRKFDCLKFRTMVPDADLVLEQLLQESEESRAEFEATHKLKDDPRVTKVGRVLRKTSLDELPQFINVLRGEMSVVGPRPIVDAEIPRYGPDLPVVLSVRPGLTGLWQVSGRNDIDYAQRVALDREYVMTQSIWRDLSIIVRTATVMVKRENGAY